MPGPHAPMTPFFCIGEKSDIPSTARRPASCTPDDADIRHQHRRSAGLLSCIALAARRNVKLISAEKFTVAPHSPLIETACLSHTPTSARCSHAYRRAARISHRSACGHALRDDRALSISPSQRSDPAPPTKPSAPPWTPSAHQLIAWRRRRPLQWTPHEPPSSASARCTAQPMSATSSAMPRWPEPSAPSTTQR